MGILLPIVLGVVGSVTGAPDALAPLVPVDPYGRSKRLGTGLAGSVGALGLASVQSSGGGRGSKPSIVACVITMLIRFSIFVSSSPCSRVTIVNALPAAPMRAVRPTRCT